MMFAILSGPRCDPTEQLKLTKNFDEYTNTSILLSLRWKFILLND